MSSKNCLICEKHNDNSEAVYQDEILYVSHYVPYPGRVDNYLGYYFIETKRHFKGMYNATDKEMSVLGIMLKNISKALMTIPEIEHVYSFIIGEGIDHFHMHVIGRYKNTPQEYYGSRVTEWPEAPRGDINEIIKLNDYIKSKLMF